MASLWSTVRKKEFYVFPPEGDTLGKVYSKQIESNPFLVNAQAIADAMQVKSVNFAACAEDVTPPQPNLWLEWIEPDIPPCRYAVLVSRIDPISIRALADKTDYSALEDARFAVLFTALAEHQDASAVGGLVLFYIDNLGLPIKNGPWKYICNEQHAGWLNTCVVTACEALTVMNTRGTRVEPPFDKPPAQVVKSNRHPHSVWHTIHLPKFLQEPMGLETSGEVVERREHWVRAHRADYRQGKGLFGRVHGLIWVPEHKRGNPELGTVKQSFEVHPR